MSIHERAEAFTCSSQFRTGDRVKFVPFGVQYGRIAKRAGRTASKFVPVITDRSKKVWYALPSSLVKVTTKEYAESTRSK